MEDTMEIAEVELVIKKIVIEQLNLDMDVSAINDELLFGTASGFDSTGLLEFILTLEEYFDIVIPDEDLDYKVFGSISQITNYILKHKGHN